ncbi:hypothetical protein ABH922_002007 [Rhodococcus sp. 27YEA15]|uniref:hypothetical protein n=1 Tax=Rhodococcus sp. 27YEA15 TaxID=3156259 RepID=UPI003C7D60E0
MDRVEDLVTVPLSLPEIDAGVVAVAIDELPTRLQKRVDAVIATRKDWVLAASDSGIRVTVAGEIVVDLAVTGNLVDSAVCSCLLSPRCAHRAAVLSACPPVELAVTAHSAVASDARHITISAAHRDAARQLWNAAAVVVENGCTATGATDRAILLRAVHAARAVGMHRGARSGSELAEQLRRFGERSAEFSLAGLHESAVDTLLASFLVATRETLTGVEIGTARRIYEPVGGLQLSGIVSEPVATAGGYAGVVTWMVDSSGVRYSMGDVQPGGVERCVPDLPVALVGSGIDHQGLVRHGLTLSGATVTDSGRLGRGSRVATVLGVVADRAWSSDVVGKLFDVPVREQLAGALAHSADHTGRHGLICCTVEVSGATEHTVRVVSDGWPLDLTVPPGLSALAYAHNLRQLGRVPGAQLRLVGRVAADRPGQIVALAVSTGGHGTSGNVRNLAWDAITHAELTASVRPPDSPTIMSEAAAERRGQAGEPGAIAAPLARASDRLHQVLRGGRRMATGAACVRDADVLRASAMPYLAQAVSELSSAAQAPDRDEFGRRGAENSERFSIAWLRAAVMVTASRDHSLHESWGIR